MSPSHPSSEESSSAGCGIFAGGHFIMLPVATPLTVLSGVSSTEGATVACLCHPLLLKVSLDALYASTTFF